jgi:hypothetical protein
MLGLTEPGLAPRKSALEAWGGKHHGSSGDSTSDRIPIFHQFGNVRAGDPQTNVADRPCRSMLVVRHTETRSRLGEDLLKLKYPGQTKLRSVEGPAPEASCRVAGVNLGVMRPTSAVCCVPPIASSRQPSESSDGSWSASLNKLRQNRRSHHGSQVDQVPSPSPFSCSCTSHDATCMRSPMACPNTTAPPLGAATTANKQQPAT